MRILFAAAAAALFLAGPAFAESVTCSTYTSNGLTCTKCCGNDSGICSTSCSAPIPTPEAPVDEPLTPCTTCQD
jgi:hypothetical protein